jgi:hypothetical protein
MSIGNIESRESDIPYFREWEHNRYEIDRTLLQVHEGRNLSESYSLDFSEAQFPLSWAEEKDKYLFMLEQGIMTKKELILKFNPDMDDAEAEIKLNEIREEEQPETPLLNILQS